LRAVPQGKRETLRRREAQEGGAGMMFDPLVIGFLLVVAVMLIVHALQDWPK